MRYRPAVALVITEAEAGDLPEHRALLDAIAREGPYFTVREAPSLEQLEALLQEIFAGQGVLLHLRDAGRLVGWSEIRIRDRHGKRLGILGYGLHRDYRQRGHGRRLAQEAMDRFWVSHGLPLALEVFASNTAGLALARSLGFTSWLEIDDPEGRILVMRRPADGGRS